MNREDKIDVKKLHLAELKYYDKDHRGIELGDALSYAFLIDCEGTYINPLNLFERYPVFKRVPYSNYTASGEAYGSKLLLADGEDVTGPCYILVQGDLAHEFKSSDAYLEELEDYVLNSDKFFKDRINIAVSRYKKHPAKLYRIIRNDAGRLGTLNAFYMERNIQLQKVR